MGGAEDESCEFLGDGARKDVWNGVVASVTEWAAGGLLESGLGDPCVGP